jgi:hypothetical protein
MQSLEVLKLKFAKCSVTPSFPSLLSMLPEPRSAWRGSSAGILEAIECLERENRVEPADYSTVQELGRGLESAWRHWTSVAEVFKVNPTVW